MQFGRRGAGINSEQRTGTFTGTVYANAILSADDLAINNVSFSPGARTYWHLHEGGQVLTVGQGRGIVAVRTGEARFVEAADVIHASAGEEHWHGATPGSVMSHTSIAIGQTVWLEEVDEASYRATCDRADQTD